MNVQHHPEVQIWVPVRSSWHASSGCGDASVAPSPKATSPRGRHAVTCASSPHRPKNSGTKTRRQESSLQFGNDLICPDLTLHLLKPQLTRHNDEKSQQCSVHDSSPAPPRASLRRCAPRPSAASPAVARTSSSPSASTSRSTPRAPPVWTLPRRWTGPIGLVMAEANIRDRALEEDLHLVSQPSCPGPKTACVNCLRPPRHEPRTTEDWEIRVM